MSSRRSSSKSESEPEATADDLAVAAYLARHRDFLVRHPELIPALEVPHGAHGAVSLLERQAEMLREQLDTERRRLAHLVARAHEYEQIAQRVHELTLQLIVARDMDTACVALQEALRGEFNAEAVALKLFPTDSDALATDPVVNAFIGFVDRDRVLCGPLRPEQAVTLFDDVDMIIRSAALVPLRTHDRTGVLAIGSTDPHRFSSDMGTDLLERLGAIASAKLTDLAHRPA
jgi:uncharacterized protein YigA (DUF484 family)